MILICAKNDDAHAVRVGSILTARHRQEVFLFDTSTFPGSLQMTGIFRNGQPGNGAVDLRLATSEREIRLPDVKAFWWRRPQPMAIDPRISDGQARNFAFQECISGLYGLLECTEGLWVNDISSDTAAEYKPYQLKVANEIGFQIPETLITNSAEQVLEFWRHHERRVIYKAFNQRAVAWTATRLLREEDLRMLDNIRYAPVIFQPVVAGIRDIRVTVVGDRIFASEFDIEKLDEIDYRVKMMEIACRPHELPRDLEAKIATFMKRLGLEYGGIDFRLTPDREYVFFEVNTAGEFLYVEDRTGQAISEAMAAHLAEGRPTFPTRRAANGHFRQQAGGEK